MTIELGYQKRRRTPTKNPSKIPELHQLPLPWTVGDKYRTEGRPATVSYQIIERFSDLHGWHNTDKALPLPMDLVQIKTADGFIKRGWYTGTKTHWDGYRLEDDEIVIAWRTTDAH